MTLVEHTRAALAAAGHPDLRMEQALEILAAYEEARANVAREHGPVGDAALLPYPKETLQWSILLLIGAIAQAAREPLKAAYLSLADWQAREDVETGGFDSSRLRRKLDPLALAQEFAARASPGDRWMAAARDERVRLIEDLRRRGFW